MKTDAVFKRAYNDALDLIEPIPQGGALPSENSLAAELGVSRTTVRKVLGVLAARALVTGKGSGRTRLAAIASAIRYPDDETVPLSANVERLFMEWMLQEDPRPGTMINELELARQFSVATTGIREFLNGFQRFGLIDKRPSAGWVFRGFTESFALELFEIREMFELRSALAFASLPVTSLPWSQMRVLRTEHELLLLEIDTRFHDFSDLDNRFHRLINSAAPNRFIDSFYDVITLIFHYHYQWNKRDERQRNQVALREHLTYIDALASRNPAMVELACRAHLASARETLLRSTSSRSGERRS